MSCFEGDIPVLARAGLCQRQLSILIFQDCLSSNGQPVYSPTSCANRLVMRLLFLSLLPVSASLVGAFACGGSPGATAICGKGQVFRNNTCETDGGVVVNGEGYLDTRRKRAVFPGASGDFTVTNLTTKTVVLEATAPGPVTSEDTEEQLFVADFSSITAEGTYKVTANGKDSEEFTISTEALQPALDTAMLGMYGWRCGVHVEFDHNKNHYEHEACHTARALLDRISSGTQDDTGGWHDAGDYGKYVNNGAFAVALLLKAYEHFPGFLDDREFAIPERGGAVPDILDESRVELEWLLKVQLPDGSFAHKVTALRFEPDLMPEDDKQERYFFSTSTASTASATAVLAEAARIYAPFDEEFSERCLDSAVAGQDFLDQNQSSISSSQEPNGVGTGTYTDQNDRDNRLWALVELWETTGEERYLSGAEDLLPMVSYNWNFDWDGPGNLGIGSYVDSSRPGRDPDLLADAERDVVEMADNIAEEAQRDAYGRGFAGYYWGTNGVIVRMAYNLISAHRLFPNRDYLDAITAQIDHVLGENPFGRSFVTQLGSNPVRAPHHRPSVSDGAGAPWPGLLIGGPHGQTDNADPDILPALNWQDSAANYWHNEVAINWNTALIYALVAAQASREDESASCVPDCLPAPSSGSAGGAGGAGGVGGAN